MAVIESCAHGVVRGYAACATPREVASCAAHAQDRVVSRASARALFGPRYLQTRRSNGDACAKKLGRIREPQGDRSVRARLTRGGCRVKSVRRRARSPAMLLVAALAVLLVACFLSGVPTCARSSASSARRRGAPPPRGQRARARSRVALARLMTREVERPYFHDRTCARSSSGATLTCRRRRRERASESARLWYFHVDSAGRVSTPPINDDIPAVGAEELRGQPASARSGAQLFESLRRRPGASERGNSRRVGRAARRAASTPSGCAASAGAPCAAGGSARAGAVRRDRRELYAQNAMPSGVYRQQQAGPRCRATREPANPPLRSAAGESAAQQVNPCAGAGRARRMFRSRRAPWAAAATHRPLPRATAGHSQIARARGARCRTTAAVPVAVRTSRRPNATSRGLLRRSGVDEELARVARGSPWPRSRPGRGEQGCPRREIAPAGTSTSAASPRASPSARRRRASRRFLTRFVSRLDRALAAALADSWSRRRAPARGEPFAAAARTSCARVAGLQLYGDMPPTARVRRRCATTHAA